jgi:hypothetical protein
MIFSYLSRTIFGYDILPQNSDATEKRHFLFWHCQPILLNLPQIKKEKRKGRKKERKTHPPEFQKLSDGSVSTTKPS